MKKVAIPIFAVVGGAWMLAVVGVQETENVPRRPLVLDRPPVRIIQDNFPVFSGITMDVPRGELIITDDSRSSILTYKSQFRPTDNIREPIRRIRGPNTLLGYVCGVAISLEHEELYAVSGDDEWAGVFPLEANGDVPPLRRFTIDHGAAGIFLDRKNDELFITSEHLNKVAVYGRTAVGDGGELRYIQGPKTGLADPHSIFVDGESNEIFVTNHGHWRRTESGEQYTSVVLGTNTGPKPLRPSTGKSLPPSVTVYSRAAHGDVAPARTIQGPKTGLNLPLGIYLDSTSGLLVIANSGGNSILFFESKANGNVAPLRVIKGPATGLDGPTGIFIDTKRDELWATNWDNHTATVYPRTGEGNIAPLRTLRSAPKGNRFAGFGNIGDVAFDPKRKEILVPN